MSAKTILHVDMDAFFAAVEQRDDPSLAGKPVVVGAPPDKRGVVAACSYEARRFGIHSAMPSRTAHVRCPQAVFLPVRMERYAEVSSQLMAIFMRFTPLVQPLSVDEAFLDVTGARRLFGDGPAIARRIKALVREETGLTCSVGVAGNLFLAKLASDLEKPDGLTVAPASREEIVAFLAPLPIGRMWGAGPKTQALLRAQGLHTFGDLQAAGPAELARWVGARAAASFRRLAFGEDDRQVEPGGEEKSVSAETTFAEDQDDPAVVERALLDQAEKVGRRLRVAGFHAGTLRIKIRWKDFSTITRQRRMDPPCCDDQTLQRTALELFRGERRRLPVRLIGFGASGLCRPGTTSAGEGLLFDLAACGVGGDDRSPEEAARREHLSRTLDALRRRYGLESVRRGSSL